MTSRNRISRSLFAVLLFVPGFFSPLLAQPQLLMMGDSGPGEPFRIGDSLVVAFSGGEPFGEYTFTLLRPDGEPITQLSTQADAVGEVPSALLWAHSGIETCQADPLGSQLASWEEAEEMWIDRVLTVQVSYGSGTVVALGTVTATAAAGERAYLSDDQGRPCNCFKSGDDVFISLRQPDSWAPYRRIFVVKVPSPNELTNDPFELEDARQSGGLEYWTLPDLGNLVTEKIWDVDDAATGDYIVILRREETPASTEAILLPGDQLIAGSWSAARSGRGIALTIDCKGGNGVR